ncbi:MAG TPA: HlyD family secretion protein [Aestuariivirga sp.]|jgi:membrane fusion protein, multidrug efflux system
MSNSAQSTVALPLEGPQRPAPKLALAPIAEMPQPPAATEAKAKRPPVMRRAILGAVVLAALSGAAYYGHDWYVLGRFEISTDDAYVKTDMAQLGAKVAGYVTEIPAAENSRVKAGDVVLKLDDGDYRLAVAAAQAHIETQKAVIAGFTSQTEAQNAQVAAVEAKLVSAEAAASNTVTNSNRAAQLIKAKVVSQQTMDDWTMKRDAAEASVSEAKADILAAQAQLDVIASNKVQAEKSLAELQTALSKTERDLSFTEIRAPFDGFVANRAVEPGQFVQGGTRLMALVPADGAYIEANFKETQLADLHAGQRAEISIDAFDGEVFEGKVLSLAPASGSEFSLLPPENATGNFTKITQRVPVKVSVPAELAEKLRPGLSVTVTVDTRAIMQ